MSSPTIQQCPSCPSEINLQTSQTTLIFSETIDFAIFSPEYIRLQNQFEPPHDQFNLTGGSVTQLSTTSVAVNLTMSDLASLKRKTTIAPTEETATLWPHLSFSET